MTRAAPISAGEALAAASAALRAAGTETARLDAELLLAEAGGLDRAALAATPERPLDPGTRRRFEAMVDRRCAREPVAYIIGRKGFRRVELAVDARVLVPRPETELLVEIALERRPATVLEVGTGSGAVALAVADELSGCRVTATDTSAAALAVAAENLCRAGTDRVELVSGSVPAQGAWDLVLANLPYVADGELARLEPEVSRHEPAEALRGGHDGLEVIRTVLAELGGSRPRCAAVALEVGAGQATAVEGLARAAGFACVERRPDLAGIDRVVVAEAADG